MQTKKRFKKARCPAVWVIAALLLCFGSGLQANNARVSNVQYLTGDSVKFDLAWDNSWRNASSGTYNYDGVWAFVKFRKETERYSATPVSFSHMWLDTSPANHYVPTGFSLDIGTSLIGGNNRGMGAFIYRSADGSGNVSLSGIKLKWDRTNQGISYTDLDIQVFVIEMVYIPTAAFYAGDGVSSTYLKDGSTTSPLQISASTAITLGTSSGNLNQSGTALSGTLPDNFPKGYESFWVMKYEVTQEQYKDFLNCLRRADQATNVLSVITVGTTTVTNTFVMSNAAAVTNRNGIRCASAIHTSKPVLFFCDLNANGAMDEAADGQTLACNFLKLYLNNYLDWAALRPMSELEFEKACRGTTTPVSYEAPWGLNVNTAGNYTYVTAVNNSGYAYETPSTPGNGTVHAGGTLDGPRRVGSTYIGGTTRIKAGAAFYGPADMAGNTWEQCIKVADASAFSRSEYGDGDLTTAAPTSWASANTILKGGAWNSTNLLTAISERSNTAATTTYIGGRGAR